jgi:Site-specific DNA methylase
MKYRTILRYPGAKWRIADWVIGHMPEHHSYVEPYFGSGAVFFRKLTSRIETINDLDENVINLFRCVRENLDRLAALVAATPYSRAEYDAAFTEDDSDGYEQARRFLVRNWQGHGFRTNGYVGWKNDVQGREAAYAVRNWYRLPDWILSVVDRLKKAQIECRPAVEVIERFNYPSVLIYADPPYVLSTRTRKNYQHEMTDGDHIELLSVLLRHKGPAMVSGYDNELYNDMLVDWSKHQIGTTGQNGVHRVETLWVKE